jgi:hypothetical protein
MKVRITNTENFKEKSVRVEYPGGDPSERSFWTSPTEGRVRHMFYDGETTDLVRDAWGVWVKSVYTDIEVAVEGNSELGVAALLPETVAIETQGGQFLLLSGRAMQIYKTTIT